MCRSTQPPYISKSVEWHHVRPNRIPFVQAFRSVGLWPLRGWNGTQAVPYETDEPCAIHPTGKYNFKKYYLIFLPAGELVFRRGNAGVFFEGGGKIGDVPVAHLLGHLVDLHTAVL